MTKAKRNVELVTDYTKDSRHFYSFNGKTMAKVFALTQMRSIFQSGSQRSIESARKRKRNRESSEGTKTSASRGRVSRDSIAARFQVAEPTLGERRPKQRRLNVHAHSIHGTPVDALEAGHVDVGERVSLVGIGGRSRSRGSRCRSGCCRGSCGGGGCRWSRSWGRRCCGRGCGDRRRRDWIWRVSIRGQRRVTAGEQLPVSGDGVLYLGSRSRGRGSLHLGLRLSRNDLRGRGNRQWRLWRQSNAQRSQNHPLAEGQRAWLNRLLGLSLLAFDFLVFDRMEVDLAHAVHHVLILERDESEATMPLRLLIHQHHRFLHLAELVEVGLHFVATSVLTYAADKDLLRAIRLFRAVLRCRVFRVDLLPVQCVDWTLQHLVHATGLGERDETEAATTL